jgi:predicted DNA-binding protein
MSTEARPADRPKPLPPKKRYSVLLPQELAERFERVAGLRHGSKSAIVEEALDRRLNPEKYPLIGDALLRRLDEQSRTIAALKRDVGHTLVVGPTGAGKSVLLSLLALQFRRFIGAQVILFDRGRSARAPPSPWAARASSSAWKGRCRCSPSPASTSRARSPSHCSGSRRCSPTRVCA